MALTTLCCTGCMIVSERIKDSKLLHGQECMIWHFLALLSSPSIRSFCFALHEIYCSKIHCQKCAYFNLPKPSQPRAFHHNLPFRNPTAPQTMASQAPSPRKSRVLHSRSPLWRISGPHLTYDQVFKHLASTGKGRFIRPEASMSIASD